MAFPKYKGEIAIAPSILSANIMNMGADIKAVEKDTDWLHVDIMDGHFVPNLSFGPSVVAGLKKVTNLPLDVHLMITNPQDHIDNFAKAGADSITVHYEAQKDMPALIKQIRGHNINAGISIKPDTNIETTASFLSIIDMILLMTVYPGFGGQKFLDGSVERISQTRALIDESRYSVWLEVDGGINAQTASAAAQAGATALVAGNAVFGHNNPAEAIKQLRELVRRK